MFAKVVFRIFFTILIFSIVGALVGGLIGFGVGLFAPEYYISIFGLSGNADAIRLGTILGCAQGLVGGAFLGAIAFCIAQFVTLKSQANPSIDTNHAENEAEQQPD